MWAFILIFEAFKAFLRMLKVCDINFVGSCLVVCVLQFVHRTTFMCVPTCTYSMSH